MKYIYYYSHKFCNLGIAEENGAICRIFFEKIKVPNDFYKSDNPLIKKASDQLDEYFDGRRKTFDLPLTLNGTDFQIDVWKALQNIPYGETRSYGQLAALIGTPRASRAVGMANNRNPIPIIIPCHRVIASNGSLSGYAGGVELKKRLLELEHQS